MTILKHRATTEQLERLVATEHETFTFDLAVVGLGYVGLPTALAHHAAGMRVLGIDASPLRLDAIAAVNVDLIAGDRERLGSALASETFTLTGEPALIADAECVVISRTATSTLRRCVLPA